MEHWFIQARNYERSKVGHLLASKSAGYGIIHFDVEADRDQDGYIAIQDWPSFDADRSSSDYIEKESLIPPKYLQRLVRDIFSSDYNKVIKTGRFHTD